MRFYTSKIVTNTDETEVRDLRGFDTLDEALVRFHSDMSSNIGKVKSILCMVINSDGGIHKNESWKLVETETETATEVLE